jgi:predicted AAA+ superfamily ATPase
MLGPVRQLRGVVDRFVAPTIRRRLGDEPVIVLVGPRTVGKSTLLQALAKELGVDVLDLDDLATRAAVTADPGLFMSAPGPVLVDEFQKAPAVLDAIKAELNVRLTPGRFVLTGSTRYETLPAAAQSLTGRAHVLMVPPLSQGEISGVKETFVKALLDDPSRLVSAAPSKTTREDYIDRAVAGGFPIPLARTGATRARWFASYVDLVIERDVLELSRVRQRAALPRLLTSLMAQTAGLLKVADAARRSGIEERTAENYTKLLEAVFMVRLLPAWGTKLATNAGATPKVHAVDTGLAAHMLRLSSDKLARRTPTALTEFGHLLETFVVGEIQKQVGRLDEVVTVGHWRTRSGTEVDLILERADGGVVGVEVKAGTRVAGPELRSLAALADKVGDSWLGGVALYTGQRAYTYDPARRVHVVPVDRLWAD